MTETVTIIAFTTSLRSKRGEPNNVHIYLFHFFVCAFAWKVNLSSCHLIVCIFFLGYIHSNATLFSLYLSLSFTIVAFRRGEFNWKKIYKYIKTNERSKIKNANGNFLFCTFCDSRITQYILLLIAYRDERVNYVFFCLSLSLVYYKKILDY